MVSVLASLYRRFGNAKMLCGISVLALHATSFTRFRRSAERCLSVDSRHINGEHSGVRSTSLWQFKDVQRACVAYDFAHARFRHSAESMVSSQIASVLPSVNRRLGNVKMFRAISCACIACDFVCVPIWQNVSARRVLINGRYANGVYPSSAHRRHGCDEGYALPAHCVCLCPRYSGSWRSPGHHAVRTRKFSRKIQISTQ